jgi:hypothetical protein
VITAGEKYGFSYPGSKGLVFALSLGDAGTVKLLLDIAEWASKTGDENYAREALIGVQTAIGRESSRLQTCMEILMYRFLYVSKFVQEWLARFLHNHFDVGYTFMHGWMLELIDDCRSENRDLIPLLRKALDKCRRAENRQEFRRRLAAFSYLQSREAKAAACSSLGDPPEDTGEEEINTAIETLVPLFGEWDLESPAAEALSKFVWLGPAIPEPLMRLYHERARNLPAALKQGIELRQGR